MIRWLGVSIAFLIGIVTALFVAGLFIGFILMLFISFLEVWL